MASCTASVPTPLAPDEKGAEKASDGFGLDPPSAQDTKDTPPITEELSSCFDKRISTVCLVRDDASGYATAEAAYEACYESEPESRRIGVRVLMAELAAGDRVLTASASGSLEITQIVVVQHKHATEMSSDMLKLGTADGSTLSLTGDHAIFTDGSLVAAADVRVGSVLLTARGSSTVVDSITKATEAREIINPVTTSGTILAADDGSRPLLVASHPIWVAPWVVESKVARYAVNAVLALVGDAGRSCTDGACQLLLGLMPVLLVVAVMLRRDAQRSK